MAYTTESMCLPPITGREKLGRALLLNSLKKCRLCPITPHFSRPLIGGRQATVVQAMFEAVIPRVLSMQMAELIAEQCVSFLKYITTIKGSLREKRSDLTHE